jgi:DNA-binding transcriptional LysR family regulator
MGLSAHVPDLAALEVLLGVARTGSLNSAAGQIGVSQQAVSARIRAMEAQTGVALRRSPRGSSLTAEGAVIAEWAARLLDVAGELDAGIAALRADRRSRLRVSSSSTIAEQLLPAWLASFRAGAERPGSPALDVVLTAVNSDKVITHVAEGTADIGFIEGLRQPIGLRSRVIGHDRLAVIVAPGHPWTRRRKGVSAAEVACTPLVSREGGSGTRDTLAAGLAVALGPAPSRPRPRCRCPPPRRSAQRCWPRPRPRSSANSPWLTNWPRAGSSRSRHPNSTCAGPCASSGPALRTRPQVRRAT